MQKIFFILPAVLLATLLSGCLTSPVQGILFTGTTHHVEGLTSGSQIGDGRVHRSGESCSLSTIIIAVFLYGNGSSIEKAAKSAGITKIAVVDRKSFSILGPLFYKECVVVWGE